MTRLYYLYSNCNKSSIIENASRCKIRCYESLRLLNDLLCFLKCFPFYSSKLGILEKKIYIPLSFSWKCMWRKVRTIFSFKRESKFRFSFSLTILLNFSYQIYECGNEMSFLFRSVNNRREKITKTKTKTTRKILQAICVTMTAWCSIYPSSARFFCRHLLFTQISQAWHF